MFISSHILLFLLNDTILINGEPVIGYVGVDTITGFNAVRDFNFSTSMSTTMYGMYAFKGGPINAIRHVFKPSLSFTWHPDFSSPEWGYYNYPRKITLPQLAKMLKKSYLISNQNVSIKRELKEYDTQRGALSRIFSIRMSQLKEN